jgi:excisionase family DNA binding protein
MFLAIHNRSWMDDMQTKEAYRVKDFCATYSVSRSTFYRLVNSGALRARKRGAATVVLSSDIQAWLESCPVITSKEVSNARAA